MKWTGLVSLFVCGLLFFSLLTTSSLASRSTTQSTVSICNRPSSYLLHVKLPREYPQLKKALWVVFGPRWKEAAIVSYGESTWHRYATNGQYKGYFQMGFYERSSTGWNWSLYGQLRAAKKWNDRTGGRWGKWSCKP